MVNKNSVQKKIIEDLEKNHNCSWARDLINKNKGNMQNIAIFYRGNKITYKSMFDKAFEYAASLKKMGVKKGMEIPMCLENCPETIYMLLACSLIGARINVFGNEFDSDYIKQIINNSKSELFVVTDDMYGKIKDTVKETDIKKIVMFSVTDSYPNGVNPYAKLEEEYYDDINLVPEYKKNDDSIIDVQDFEKIGKDFKGQIEEESKLDDIFSITYSSGSTNSTKPKAIVHRVQSFNAMGKAHDGDTGDTPKMNNLTVMASIPTHSNTCLISSISDTLFQGCTVAMEYVYDRDFFPIALLINKPNFCPASRSFWINAMKTFNDDPKYKNVKLPFLFVPLAAGEPLSPGEEKYLNKSLRKHKAGTDFIKLPVSAITMSAAGGDCEHGGIFYIIFKALREKDPRVILNHEPLGLRTYSMVDYAVLDEYGNHCKVGEHGRLVADSPCTMVEYKNNSEATSKFFVKDSEGRTWGDCKVHAYLDKFGGVHMKGRIPDNNEIVPPYLIQDEVLKDTKKIMSCEVICFSENAQETYVVHIEPQPGTNFNTRQELTKIESRLAKKFPTFIMERIVYKVRNYTDSFPLSGCGKRSNLLLSEEKLSGTIKIINSKYGPSLCDGESYIDNLKNVKSLSLK